MIRHDHMVANDCRKRAHQIGAVYRVGPWLGLTQPQCVALLAAIIEFVAFGHDQAIEDCSAHIQTLSRLLAFTLKGGTDADALGDSVD
jgi:hypothetical protein